MDKKRGSKSGTSGTVSPASARDALDKLSHKLSESIRKNDSDAIANFQVELVKSMGLFIEEGWASGLSTFVKMLSELDKIKIDIQRAKETEMSLSDKLEEMFTIPTGALPTPAPVTIGDMVADLADEFHAETGDDLMAKLRNFLIANGQLDINNDDEDEEDDDGDSEE